MTWRLHHVDSLYKEFVASNADFAVSAHTLREWIHGVLPDPTPSDVVHEWIWPKLQCEQECNILELFGGLAVISNAALDEKILFLCQVFDLNSQGSLSYDEICFGLLATLAGTVLMMCRTELPTEGTIEKCVDAAFRHASKQPTTDRLSYTQIAAWLQDDYLPARCRDSQIFQCTSPFELLVCFNLAQPLHIHHRHSLRDDSLVAPDLNSGEPISATGRQLPRLPASIARDKHIPITQKGT